MLGRNIFLIFISILFCIANLNSQSEEYRFYKKLKSDPGDSITLKIIESYPSYHYYDLLHILVAHCAQNKTQSIKYYLKELAKYGLDKSQIELILKNRGVTNVEKYFGDTIFTAQFQETIVEFNNLINSDTIAQEVENLYRLDQEARKHHKGERDKYNIRLIDSLNLMKIRSFLHQNLISSQSLGIHLEEKLYLILLHSCRYTSNHEFDIIQKYLIKLVQEDKFHPIYYANIIDERLRVNKNAKYPVYNFLRNIKVDDKTQLEIEKNRQILNAY